MNIKPKILIVDDKKENLIALEKTLSMFKVEFVRALSGNEALGKIIDNEFALALIDVQMPDMDGYETVKLMRQSKEAKYLPIIFISAVYSENYYAIKGIETGAVDFISKPYNPKILQNKVKVFLDLYKQKHNLSVLVEKLTEKIHECDFINKKYKKEMIEAGRENYLKTVFLSNMSHELRTPLNSIIGFSEILENIDTNNDEKKIYFDYVRKNAYHVLNLINDIIDISKIEANKIRLELNNCDINALLDELFIMYKEDLKRNEKFNVNLKLNKFNTEKNYFINTDSTRLKQILINLLSNALKFTSKGEIEFGYFVKPETENFITFYVKDTGIGISQDNIDTIFETYKQILLDKTKNSGLGLGLAISKNLVEMLGGKIWVESQIDKGSCFYFNLPNISLESNTSEVKNITLDLDKQKNVIKDKTFLVVEDFESNFRYVEAVLLKKQAKVLWASTGPQAVEIFKANKNNIDMVLMDIQLPGFSGFKAFKFIREIDKKVPVISITAYALKIEKQKCLDEGFTDYLAKPFKINELLSIINKHLVYERKN